MAGLVDSVKKFFSKKGRTKRRDQRQQDIVLEARRERFEEREAKKAARAKRASITNRVINGK